MSQRTQFITTFLIISLVIIGLSVHFLFFQQVSLNHPSTYDRLAGYRLNALIIRFRTFDSIISGTSMGQNFKCTDFDRITGDFSYKLTASGVKIPQTCKIIEFACKRHKIRSVLLDMHTLLLINAPQEESMRYYNDNSLWGDLIDGVSLWSLKDREKYYKRRFRSEKKDTLGWTRDDIYCWDDGTKCSRAALAHDILRGTYIKDVRLDLDLKYISFNVQENLLPLIKSHPEITFYLFLPPFTPFAYFWKGDDMMLARKAVMDYLLPLPNVRLYDFQGCSEICLEFDQYKDITHYSAKISEWILEQIKDDNFRVTPQNRHIFEKRLSDMLKNFDMEKEIDAMKEYGREHPLK